MSSIFDRFLQLRLYALLAGALLTGAFFAGCVSKPVYGVGSDEGDWWIEYPDKNADHAGEEVEHPDWILDGLDEMPVVFVVHRTGCTGCQAQADRMIDAGERYEGKIIFHDLDGAYSDQTSRVNGALATYDPNGGQHYIALTCMLTKVRAPDGSVAVGWHSWEGDMGQSDIDAWIKDAISYYKINS